jgi:glutathione S-transferase
MSERELKDPRHRRQRKALSVKLYASKASPYARKARVCALELGLGSDITMVETDPRDPSSGFWNKNPLGKIPVLEVDEGAMIHDSRVICEYLDQRFGSGRLLPQQDLWRLRTLVALADGIMDAGMAARLERMRPEAEQSPGWIETQLAKVERGFDALEAQAATLGERPDLGTIAVGCAVFWIGFRHPDRDWLGPRPALRGWNERFSQRASMQETVPEKPL